MILPTIHNNGTSRESLMKGFQAARDALEVAVDKMREAAPNGRDYYPQGAGALEVAATQHRARVATVRNVINDLNDIIAHCDGD